MAEHGLILITCGEPYEARSIARRLVETRVAAGAQIIPIGSIYRWEGEVVEGREWILVAKTRRDRFESVRSVVDELHSYEVPPVLMIAIDEASRPYLAWIDQNVDIPT
ncbi:MAG: divalent-cation tolerance protein CutA [Acidimicrobiia bacterium]